MDLLSFVEFFVEGYNEDIQRQVVKQICSAVVNYGEQSQVSGGESTHDVHGRIGTSFDQLPSHLYNSWTEVERHCLYQARSACEELGESHEG